MSASSRKSAQFSSSKRKKRFDNERSKLWGPIRITRIGAKAGHSEAPGSAVKPLLMLILPQSGSPEEVVDCIQVRLLPTVSKLVGLATTLLLIMLQMVYMVGHDLNQLDADTQLEVWDRLGVIPRDNWLYHDLLKYFCPAPDKSDPVARKRVQNRHSRYAKALRLAEQGGIRPQEFVKRVTKAGGLEAFLRRYDTTPMSSRLADKPRQSHKRSQTFSPSYAATRSGARIEHPAVNREYKVKVKSDLRSRFVTLTGRQVAIVDADSEKGRAIIEAIDHAEVPRGLNANDLLEQILGFLSGVK